MPVRYFFKMRTIPRFLSRLTQANVHNFVFHTIVIVFFRPFMRINRLFLPASALFACAILIALGACSTGNSEPYAYQRSAFSTEGMVVSVHPLATDAGVEILRAGGNAVDAAIAVHLALAVVYPRAGNLGGGGFMLYRAADGETAALDFREKAPLAAYRDMYLDSVGNVIDGLSTKGHLAAGVPGSIAGLHAAHERYGTMSWASLCAPSIRYARDGHRLTRFEAERFNTYRDAFLEYNAPDIPFVSQEVWHTGDRFVQAELSHTLSRIAEKGASEFYTGQTAGLIIAEMQRGGGIITRADLEQYRPVWRTPVMAEFRGYKMIGMPPPSSGGIAVAQLLKIATQHPLGAWGHRDMRTVHLMTEAERRVFADRATYLGDADFYHVPVDSLLEDAYLKSRMHDFNLLRATASESAAGSPIQLSLDVFETTHFTVVDKHGNAVAMTVTLNTNYGSCVYVHGGGFFLNNEMDDFSIKPGVPNFYGLIGAEANAIAPGKRMLSSMSPTIVEKDGKCFLTVGTPGGSSIITSVFQTILNVTEFGMTGSQAVAAPRFHHQWLPDEIIHEKGCFTTELEDNLRQMGHTLREVNAIGTVEMIVAWPDGRWEGAADPRESSHARGL